MTDLIAFDADDTLWHDERLYQATEARFYSRDGQARAELFQAERRNLATYGYGPRSFGLSVIETVVRLSGGRVRGDEIGQSVEPIQEMARTAVQLRMGGLRASALRLVDARRAFCWS